MNRSDFFSGVGPRVVDVRGQRSYAGVSGGVACQGAPLGLVQAAALESATFTLAIRPARLACSRMTRRGCGRAVAPRPDRGVLPESRPPAPAR